MCLLVNVSYLQVQLEVANLRIYGDQGRLSVFYGADRPAINFGRLLLE